MSDVPPPPPPGHLTPPRGYVGYGVSSGIAPSLQRIRGIGKTLEVLVIIQIPMQLLVALLGWQLSDKAADFVAGRITEDEFTGSSQSLFSALATLLLIPIAVLTFVWMYRQAFNVKAIGREGLRWSPIWAIVGWFLPPCVLYVIPWLMFIELWKASDPDAPVHGVQWRSRPVGAVVHTWWVLYGLVPLLGLVTSASLFNRLTNNKMIDYAQQMIDNRWTNVAFAVLGALAAAAYARLVRGLTGRHARLIGEG